MARTKQTDRLQKRPFSEISTNSNVNFEDETEYHDSVFIVGEKKFFVVSGILSKWSKFFRTQFNVNREEEGAKMELEVKDVDPDIFESFLYLLYGSNPKHSIASYLVKMIELSIRFEAPKVLDGIKATMMEHSNNMIDSDLLETACKHKLDDIKDFVIEYLKAVFSQPRNFDEDFLDCVVKYNLAQLQAIMVETFLEELESDDCIKMLDYAEKKNIPTLKEDIIEAISVWKVDADKNTNHYYGSAEQVHWPTISEEMILPLAQCAFKHNVDVFKALIRHRIFYFAKATDFYVNEVQDDVESAHRITVNAFFEKNHQEILALPKEIMDFVLMSTISPE